MKESAVIFVRVTVDTEVSVEERVFITGNNQLITEVIVFDGGKCSFLESIEESALGF